MTLFAEQLSGSCCPDSQLDMVRQPAEAAPLFCTLTFLIVLFRWFVYNGTMLETPEIEHSYAAIRATTYKNIDTVGAKSDIKHFLIVSNQLSFSCKSWDIPYRACSINTRGYYQTWR